MGDCVMSPGTMLGAPPDLTMVFEDYMDELFLDGCWLETTDVSNFLHQSPTNSSTLFDPSFLWPVYLETKGDLSRSQAQRGNQEERQSPLLNESQEAPLGAHFFSQNKVRAEGCSSYSEINPIQGSEIGRSWWIDPRAHPSPACSVMERVIRAILNMRDSIGDKDALIQVWIPVNRGGRCVLTTDDRLFLLHATSPRLAKYREISVNYQFSAETDSEELVAGLPGRVFLGKVPEWTPDVRFFRIDEYLRVDHAQRYDVRGTLALPVFEQGSKTCLAVIEVVMTTQQIKYRPELGSVCKALEDVDLSSSGVVSTPNVKAFNKSYRASLPEIKDVLRSACEMHELPLAQMWVSCIHQGKDGCRHSEENYNLCVSTVDHACYVHHNYIHSFHEACSEHHLLKGQGVVGEAFLTNQPCFSPDITCFGKTDYPLAHHARMFGLRAAVAIRLRSIDSSADDFVLEFFLPINCTNLEDQREILTSLYMIIKQVYCCLRVISDKELVEESKVSINKLVAPTDGRSSLAACLLNIEQNNSIVPLPTKENSSIEIGEDLPDSRESQEDSKFRTSTRWDGECSNLVEESFPSVCRSKTEEKRSTKAEKNISLQVLQQYFAGSLKDAAKNMGVCTTNLKRICRQHGIKRWPSRKIKKVGQSLRKLQLVIDSVQGASSAFQIDSFYSKFPELASPSFSASSPFSTSNQNVQPRPSTMQPEVGKLSLQATTPKSPSSSCSQNSFSGHSFSSKTQHHHPRCNVPGMVGDDSVDGILKRHRSEGYHKTCSLAKLLPRSQSHETLGELTKYELELPLPIISNKGSQTQDAHSHRVKVTYGDEKSRFRLPKNWTYKDLSEEIARRFNIGDMSKFDIKYLDDDNEWVLLTCDADLKECLDVSLSSPSCSSKLSVHVSNYSWRNSSGSRSLS